MENLIAYTDLLLEGTVVTVSVGVASLILSVILGLLGAWAKLSKSKPAQWVAGTYTTLIRGVPDLVLMLLIFYGGQILINDLTDAAGLGYMEIDAFTAGVSTIGFIFGAYMTETFRGAILAIPRGEIEAAVSCGMSRPLIFRRIIWPHLVRLALPSFGNNWLVLIKATALCSVIGLEDVVRQADLAGKSVREPFTFMAAVMVVFLAITTVSIQAMRWAEKRYSVGVRRG